tara:strand:- start:77 stop:301 length:225 start_codon:yes stop_codon:yes gene_type:complete
MDKKELFSLLNEIVNKVAADNELNEAEARTFVGVALRRGKEAFLKTVSIPQLAVASDRIKAASDATADTDSDPS